MQKSKENCNIVKEKDEGFTKHNKGKANIYCLDDRFNIIWIIDAPVKNNSFPNEIKWNKQIIRRLKENGYLELDVIDISDTFICSSWSGHTITVEYETGKILSKEFTR